MAGLPHRSQAALRPFSALGCLQKPSRRQALSALPGQDRLQVKTVFGRRGQASTTPSCAPMHGRTMMPAPKTLGRTLQFGYSGCALCGWPAHCRRQTAGRCVQAVRSEFDHRLRHYRGHPRPCNRTGGDGFRGRDHLRHRHLHSSFFLIGLEELDIRGFLAAIRGRLFLASALSVTISLLVSLAVTTDIFFDLGLNLDFTQALILSQKVCAGRIRTNVPTPGYNIQSLFRILPQHTVALRCAK